MKKLTYLVISLISILSLPFLIASPAFAAVKETEQVSSRPGLFVHHVKPFNGLRGSSAEASENWAGYAVTGNNGSFNSVSSSWTQPALNCSATPNKNTYSSYWVGLDGYSDQTVEQIGTEANCVNNVATYNAWYEMYPQNPYELNLSLPVNPGNNISASVSYVPGASTTRKVGRRIEVVYTNPSYLLTLKNNTTGISYSTSVTSRYTANRSSAEVITEAPYSGQILPLADFNTANYTSSLVNGTPMGVYANLQNIIMDNPSGMIATPSNFDGTNENFSVTWSA